MGQGIVQKQGTTNANECTMFGMGEYDLRSTQNRECSRVFSRKLPVLSDFPFSWMDGQTTQE